MDIAGGGQGKKVFVSRLLLISCLEVFSDVSSSSKQRILSLITVLSLFTALVSVLSILTVCFANWLTHDCYFVVILLFNFILELFTLI